jgi:hypothetical protein
VKRGKGPRTRAAVAGGDPSSYPIYNSNRGRDRSRRSLSKRARARARARGGYEGRRRRCRVAWPTERPRRRFGRGRRRDRISTRVDESGDWRWREGGGRRSDGRMGFRLPWVGGRRSSAVAPSTHGAPSLQPEPARRP